MTTRFGASAPLSKWQVARLTGFKTAGAFVPAPDTLSPQRSPTMNIGQFLAQILGQILKVKPETQPKLEAAVVAIVAAVPPVVAAVQAVIADGKSK